MNIEVFEHGGREIKLALPGGDDHIARAIHEAKDFYEADLLRFLGDALKEGDLVLDVGANIGNHTVFFAGVVGCQVVCYEPVPAAVELLRENVALNNLESRVEVRPFAVGERSGRAAVQSEDAKNLGATRLTMGAEGAYPLVCLDDESFPGVVRLLKVDIEGMDAQALRGARRLLAQHRPLVVCEAATEEEFREIREVLSDAGYTAVGIFCATPTYLFVPSSTEAELYLAIRYGWAYALAKHLELKVLTAQHRDTRRTVIKYSQQIEELFNLSGEIRSMSSDSFEGISQIRAELEAQSETEHGHLTELRSIVDSLAVETHEASARHAAREVEIAGLRAASSEAGEGIGRLRSELHAYEGRMDGLSERVDHHIHWAHQRLSDGDAQARALRSELQSHEGRMDGLSERIDHHIHWTHQHLSDGDTQARAGVARVESELQGLAAEVGASQDALRASLALLDAVIEERGSELKALKDRIESVSVEMVTLAAKASSDRAAKALKISALDSAVRGMTVAIEDDRKAWLQRSEELEHKIDHVNNRHEALLRGRIFGTLAKVKKVFSRARSEPQVVPALPAPVTEPAVVIASHARMTRPKGTLMASQVVVSPDPLVSVIMTTFNSCDSVRNAIGSILAQERVRLELIVVDDASTDSTADEVRAAIAGDSRARLVQLSANRGTYWAKNVGIRESSGDLVTFMDSDDFSEPDRLVKQVDAIRQTPGAVASTCNYVRKNPAGEIVLNRGLAERIALISLMAKRQVFSEVGYFDSVRTSADDEMLQRIKLAYGRPRIVNVAEPLYIALLREGSLSTAAGNANDLSASDPQVFLSAARQHYAKSYQAWHDDVSRLDAVPYVPFPSTNRPFEVKDRLKIDGDRFLSQPVMAFMASFPARQEKLKLAVRSLLPQVDHLYVYLNGYEEAPDFLKDSRITALPAVKLEDLRDNGKIFHMAEAPQGYYLTVDDDIEYPADYVESLVQAIERYDRKAIVGVHGVILESPFTRYFSPNRTVFSFKHALAGDQRVNLLGTGTVAFHSSCIRPLLSMFPTTGMADVWMAIAAKRLGIPMMTVRRPAAWLKPIVMQGESDPTLYDEFRENDAAQTAALKSVGSWSLT